MVGASSGFPTHVGCLLWVLTGQPLVHCEGEGCGLVLLHQVPRVVDELHLTARYGGSEAVGPIRGNPSVLRSPDDQRRNCDVTEQGFEFGGQRLNATGLTADLRAGRVQLESGVHGQFQQQR